MMSLTISSHSARISYMCDESIAFLVCEPLCVCVHIFMSGCPNRTTELFCKHKFLAEFPPQSCFKTHLERSEKEMKSKPINWNGIEKKSQRSQNENS